MERGLRCGREDSSFDVEGGPLILEKDLGSGCGERTWSLEGGRFVV